MGDDTAMRKIDIPWNALAITTIAFAWFCDHTHQPRLGALGGVALVAVMVVLAVARIVRDDVDRDGPKVRMYCIMAKDSLDLMKGVRGKMIAQGGHAYLHAFWDAETRFGRLARLYRRSDRAYKICLVVQTVAELERLRDAYQDVCGVHLVKDAAFTVFDAPTVTCLGIGPITEDLIGEDLKSLKTLT